MSAWGGLARSRKFWLLVLDVVISSVLYFTGKYAVPEAAGDIKVAIGLLQPVFVAVIASIAVEDAAEKAGTAIRGMLERDRKLRG